MIGTAVLDAQREFEGFDFSTAERWHVLVLDGTKPAARVDLPSPGAISGDALVRAALLRHADADRARAELLARLRGRLAGSRPSVTPLRASVVVCTHRRSHYLPDILRSLGALDPAPFEVIIVDNDPGEEDCRELVERTGFRYLREDRRGLDNARNTGLRAAQGEIVVFTDDDVVLSPAWLAPLSEAFSREGVAAVTGPAFPYLLDTPARVRAEGQASLTRGIVRREFDLRAASPLAAGSMGVGANIAVRRTCLLDLGLEPFPPELDAGTETESGGDTYLVVKLLAAGGRVVYEPEMFVFHQHRPDMPTLRRAVFGYGIGMSASLAKLLVEDHELATPRPWSWLVKQYLKTQRRRAVGQADAIETRLSWDYLRGGFLGLGRWREALGTQRVAAAIAGPARLPAPSAPAEPVAPPAGAELSPVEGTPAISVIVPTYRREQTLGRCLQALAEQDVAPETLEVVVVDDDPEGFEERASGGPEHEYGFELRRLANAGKGAAAARNHGAAEATAPLLLFLDDDIVADPWLVRRHLEWHGGRNDGVLVGSCRPRPVSTGLAARAASLWWQEFFGLLEEAEEMTFVGALTGNMSVSRATLDRVGSFSEEYARARREDWEWGLRVRSAGVSIEFDGSASARHEFSLRTEDRLRHAQSEGLGDTLIAAGYPQALPSLPLPEMRPITPSHPLRWLAFRLWERPAIRRLTVLALDLLERMRLREAWSRLFVRAQSAAYAQGAYEGDWRAAGRPTEASETVELELLSDQPFDPPPVAAQEVRVLIAGEEVTRVFPTEGVWASAFAEQVVDWMGPWEVTRAVALGGWLEDAEEEHDHADHVEVIFGPANSADDLDGRSALEEQGAIVRVADGEEAAHWQESIALAEEGTRPLVAFPLPGTRPEPAWLSDSLAGFDGERVALVFGGGLGVGSPPEPLYLHDSRSADPTLFLVGDRPAYLVVRRDLLPTLRVGGGLLDPIASAVAAALEEGVVGHRHCRGLRLPSYGARARGEAYARVEVGRLTGAVGPDRARALGSGVARGALTLGWQAWKQRGRLSTEQRGLAVGVARVLLSRRRSIAAGGRGRALSSDSPPAP